MGAGSDCALASRESPGINSNTDSPALGPAVVKRRSGLDQEVSEEHVSDDNERSSHAASHPVVPTPGAHGPEE